MVKKCFLVVGPESAGNRLTAAILIRAGCIGDASTDQTWDASLPEYETPAVVIRSFPHGELWPDLSALINTLHERDYFVTLLITVREIGALAASQIARGHCDADQIDARVRESYLRIFDNLALADDFVLVPHESFVLHTEKVVASLLERIGLAIITDGPVTVDGEQREITDENGKHYVDLG